MRTARVYISISQFVFSILLVIGFSSCDNGSKKAQKEVQKTIKKEIEEYTYPLPSAFEVTNMLNEIEASYIVGISNDPEKADNYFSEKSKALNLGIYTADLAYSVTYNKKAEIQSYFTSIETLVRELDFTAAISQDIPDQIEENIDNKDKLVGIITEMFQDAYAFMNKQGRSELSYLVLAGTVIEGLYLTTHISENTFQNPKLIAAILFQKEPLLDLQKMMESEKQSELLREVYLEIQRINSIYGLEPGNTSMTEDQINKLTETLTKIRDGYAQ